MKQQLIDKLTQLSVCMDDKNIESNMPGSLLMGTTGHFLFRLYYQRFLDKPNPDLESELVKFITDEIQSGIQATTFNSGISGFAWFLAHLKTNNFIDLDEDLLIEFDEVVLETAKVDFAAENHDFLHGALGNMAYLAERCKTADQHQKFNKPLFDLLMSSSDENEDGLFWVESNNMLSPSEKGQEIIRLHLSHGQASKIMVLAKMVENGFHEAEPKLCSAINYLLAQENKNQNSAMIPYSIVDGNTNEYAHLGWCRGNISIAIVLSHAAQVLKDDAMHHKAIEIGRHTLRHSDIESARINDSAFCHGRTGLAQLYNRLYVNTGVLDFQKQAELWMEQALAESNFEDGIAGFKSRDNIKNEWVNDYSLLTGAAGIGLCLLAYIDPERMDWDSCFLIS